MPMKITMTTTVDRATADALEREAKQRGIKISPMLRQVLDAYVQSRQGQQPSTSSGQKPS